MSFSGGNQAVFKLGPASGAVTDVTDYTNDSTLTKELDALETTTFRKTARTYIVGLKDATAKLGGHWDETFDALMATVDGVMAKWEYYPNGEGSGKVKYAGQGIITNYELNSTLDDPNAWSSEIQVSDAITRTLVP